MGRKSRTKHEHHDTPPAAAVPRPVDESKLLLPLCAALVVLVLVIYAQVGSHTFLNYDDNQYITANAHVKSGFSADAIRWSLTTFAPNWHPLTWFTYLVDITLFGVNAAAMLYANVLLHIASTLLLFLFLRRTTGMLWRSATVAALWAVHPLRVESVAWVSERKDVLCALFFFLSIWFYAKWSQSQKRGHYIASVAMFAIGLTAKGMLVTLPFVLILLDYWPLRRYSMPSEVEASTTAPRTDSPHSAHERPRSAARFDGPSTSLGTLLIEKIPFFVILIPGLATTFLTQKKIEAMATTDLVSPAARVANAVLSYVAYIGKTFWPSHLANPYPLRTVLSTTAVFLGAVLLMAITAIAWMMRKRHPYLLIGWLWYLGMAVPVIGFVQIGSQSMADRYTYLPTVGLLFALVWLISDLVKQTEALRAVAVMAIVGLTVAAFVQTTYWKDSESLFRHSIAVSERNRIAHTFLGLALLEKEQFGDAASAFRESLALNPNDELARNGLSTALAASGNTNASEQELRDAIARNPNGVDAYRQLGRMLLSAGRRDEAIPMLEKAIALKPDDTTRASLAAAHGNIDEAAALYRRAIAANPQSAEGHNDLAAMLASAGKEQEALAEYNEALRLDPHQYDVRMNLGALLSRMNDDAGAVGQFEAAAKERPKSPEPHVYLALTHAGARRFDKAIEEAKQAMAIDHAAASSSLSNALRRSLTIDQFLSDLQQQR